MVGLLLRFYLTMATNEISVVFNDDDDASEEEREDLFLDTGERKINKSRESRKEREEKLKKMMEDDGEKSSRRLHSGFLLTSECR